MLEPSADNFSDLVARKQASEVRKQVKYPAKQAWGVDINFGLERRLNCDCGKLVCSVCASSEIC